MLPIVPEREKEAKEIFDFICKAENGANAPLCLAGGTGYGKTSLVEKITHFMMRIDSVRVAYINCKSWSNTKPQKVFNSILQLLFGEPRSTKAAETLTEKLRKSVDKTKIIILDELDDFINE